MGTATNSPPIMALEPNAWPEANWLAVPIFRDVYFYHGLLACGFQQRRLEPGIKLLLEPRNDVTRLAVEFVGGLSFRCREVHK